MLVLKLFLPLKWPSYMDCPNSALYADEGISIIAGAEGADASTSILPFRFDLL